MIGGEIEIRRNLEDEGGVIGGGGFAVELIDC